MAKLEKKINIFGSKCNESIDLTKPYKFHIGVSTYGCLHRSVCMASDQGIHCLLWSTCLNFRINAGISLIFLVARVVEALLMSTNNICFRAEIRIE